MNNAKAQQGLRLSQTPAGCDSISPTCSYSHAKMKMKHGVLKEVEQVLAMNFYLVQHLVVDERSTYMAKQSYKTTRCCLLPFRK